MYLKVGYDKKGFLNSLDSEAEAKEPNFFLVEVKGWCDSVV